MKKQKKHQRYRKEIKLKAIRRVLGVRGITLRIREDYCWLVNHKKVHRIMKRLGLIAVIRKKSS